MYDPSFMVYLVLERVMQTWCQDRFSCVASCPQVSAWKASFSPDVYCVLSTEKILQISQFDHSFCGRC